MKITWRLVAQFLIVWLVLITVGTLAGQWTRSYWVAAACPMSLGVVVYMLRVEQQIDFLLLFLQIGAVGAGAVAGTYAQSYLAAAGIPILITTLYTVVTLVGAYLIFGEDDEDDW